jgi:hypothetical protein
VRTFTYSCVIQMHRQHYLAIQRKCRGRILTCLAEKTIAHFKLNSTFSSFLTITSRSKDLIFPLLHSASITSFDLLVFSSFTALRSFRVISSLPTAKSRFLLRTFLCENHSQHFPISRIAYTISSRENRVACQFDVYVRSLRITICSESVGGAISSSEHCQVIQPSKLCSGFDSV